MKLTDLNSNFSCSLEKTEDVTALTSLLTALGMFTAAETVEIVHQQSQNNHIQKLQSGLSRMLKLENDADEQIAKEVVRSESCSKIMTPTESEMSILKYRKCGKCDADLEVKNPGKVSKQCPLCGVLVAGAGPSWRWQLYSHISRRHFSKVIRWIKSHFSTKHFFL